MKLWSVDSDNWVVFSLGDGFTVRYNIEEDCIDESEWLPALRKDANGDLHFFEETAEFLEELLEGCREEFTRICIKHEASCFWPKAA